MTKALFLILLSSVTLSAQQKFDVKDASKRYDVRVEVGECKEESCSGRLRLELFKKSQPKPFQVIDLDDTEFALEEVHLTNGKRMYEYQSVVFSEDYNFDGMEDLSVRDGNNSGYGGPSYRVYLYSPRAAKFVFSQAFTDLGQVPYLGMFEVDRKRRRLRASSKSGCCWHSVEEFVVANNRPEQVLVEERDATNQDDNRIVITTSRLIRGRWRTTVRYEERGD